ncbi:MAG: hypothetical protein U1F77_01520 [Kiritimatiellia bacterium]
MRIRNSQMPASNAVTRTPPVRKASGVSRMSQGSARQSVENWTKTRLKENHVEKSETSRQPDRG